MAMPPPPRTDDPREREEWFLEIYKESIAADSRASSTSTADSASLSAVTSRIDSAHP